MQSELGHADLGQTLPQSGLADNAPMGQELPGAAGETMQQQIGRLQQRVAELEAELAATRSHATPRVPFNWRAKALPLFVLLVTLLFAALPPLLVLLDRWLEVPAVTYLLHDFWCHNRALCESAFPSYFVVIFPGLVGLLALVAVPGTRALLGEGEQAGAAAPAGQNPGAQSAQISRRQGRIAGALLALSVAGLVYSGAGAALRHVLPGWAYALACLGCGAACFLWQTPASQVTNAWRRNRAWLAPLALAVGCGIALLASIYATPRPQWIFALLLALAAYGLRGQHRRIPPIIWISILGLILFSLNMNAWWLSSIGDEYSFFTQAREIVERQGLPFIGSQLFQGRAVYETHPYFSSLIQAISMGLLGSNGFGWRFSNAFLCAAAIALFYPFFRVFLARRTALWAALLLAASHYIMSFGKIGYNNLQALFAMSLALAAAAWAVRSTRPLAFAALGGALGLCFYVYPAALYIVPIPLFFLLLYCPPTTRARLGRWGLLAATLLALLYPLLLQPGYWQAKIPGTFLYNPQLAHDTGKLASHLLRNFAYALFSFLYIPSEGHFVVSSFVDPLTGALTCLGIASLIPLLFRRRGAFFLLSSFVILVFLVGASHDRSFPPITRMFLLLPWLALFAAVGLEWVVDQARRLDLWRVRPVVAAGALALLVIGLNLYQAYPLARHRLDGLQTFDSLVVRLVQRAQRDEFRSAKTYAFITNPSWTSEGFQLMPSVYPLHAQFTDVVVQGPELPPTAQTLLSDPKTLVIVEPWLDQGWQSALAEPLRNLGKEPCPIKTTGGNVRFTLWHAPGQEWLCQ